MPAKRRKPSQKRALTKGAAPTRFPRLSEKQFTLLFLSLIAIYAFLVRSLHLLKTDHYYMVSADSYIFHWGAQQILDGQPIPPEMPPSGLAYPLAYLAKAISFISPLSPSDALTFTCKFLPPTLGVISVIVIYLAVSKIYNSRVALFSALSWALLPPAYFMQAAGYVDRDGLSVLLIMIGAFAFYLSREWHLKIGRLDLGWGLAALVVIGIELILYLEWSWVGVGLLLIIVITYFVVELLAKFLRYEEPSLAIKYQPTSKQLSVRAMATIKESNWQPLALIVFLNLLVAVVNLRLTSSVLGIIKGLLFPGGGGFIAEMQGLALADVFLYQFFIFLILLGLYVALKFHRPADIFCLSWLVALFVLSLFARRVILYVTPAAAILSGLALAAFFDFRYTRRLERNIQKVVAVIILAILIALSPLAYSLGSDPRMAPDNNWYDALIYLRENTPPDAVIMSWWDYGYWILDVAQRRPVVDNGLYGHGTESDHDVGRAYCATQPSEAIQIMQKYGASYLVFSTIEEAIFPAITYQATGTAYGKPQDLPNSLYYRSLWGDFQSEQGLKVVYQNPEVVILGLEPE